MTVYMKSARVFGRDKSHLEKRGIVKELLDCVVGEARTYGCGSVRITASDMGVKLYKAYGFKHNGNSMMFDL